MDHEKYLKALLELRDIAPLEPEVDPMVEADIQSLNQVRDDLRKLSEVHPPPYVWQKIDARLNTVQHQSFLQSNRWSLAMAASLFVGAMLVMLTYQVPGDAPRNQAMIVVETNDKTLNKLIAQSQVLERRMHNTSRGYFVSTDTRGALLQRISDIDAQLSRLAYANSEYSPELKHLWQQRVNVMQSMLAMEQPQIASGYTL